MRTINNANNALWPHCASCGFPVDVRHGLFGLFVYIYTLQTVSSPYFIHYHVLDSCTHNVQCTYTQTHTRITNIKKLPSDSQSRWIASLHRYLLLVQSCQLITVIVILPCALIQLAYQKLTRFMAISSKLHTLPLFTGRSQSAVFLFLLFCLIALIGCAIWWIENVKSMRRFHVCIFFPLPTVSCDGTSIAFWHDEADTTHISSNRFSFLGRS